MFVSFPPQFWISLGGGIFQPTGVFLDLSLPTTTHVRSVTRSHGWTSPVALNPEYMSKHLDGFDSYHDLSSISGLRELEFLRS